jgi:DNA-directed RNA polymerase specialized sigma24 family protein
MQAEQEAQFQEFVRARWSRLVRTAYLLTGDVHHAEDLTQTALAKAYRSWRRVSRTDNPEAYVRRMLVSCNSDRFRKRRVTESLTAAPPEVAGRDDVSCLRPGAGEHRRVRPEPGYGRQLTDHPGDEQHRRHQRAR